MLRTCFLGAPAPTLRLLLVAALSACALTPLALAPPSAAAVTDLCAAPGAPQGTVRFQWLGDGPGDTHAWSNGQNWAGGVAPNYFGTPGSDTSTTGFVCIDPLADNVAGSTASIYLDDTVNVHVLSIDIAAGTSIDLGVGPRYNARLFAHGDPDTYLSHIDAGATVAIDASTLGGRGDWLVEGTVTWDSLGAGLAATLDTDVCHLTTDLAACAAGAPPGPGRLLVGGGGLLDVTGGDVNLKDGFGVSVESGGVFRLSTGSVAADRDTHVATSPGGLLDLAGDTNVFEGMPVGRPPGDLADLVNDGTVRKSAGNGISALNVDYTGGGAVDVDSGTLSIADGSAAPVSVERGLSLSTAACPRGPDGDRTPCRPSTTATDTQQATLTVPADQPADAEVVLVEEATATDGALQPAVQVVAPALETNRVTRLAFEYRRTAIPGFPPLTRVAVFRGRASLRPRRIPFCDEGGRVPPGVSACLADRSDRGRDRVGFTVLTTRPGGRWTIRPVGDPPTVTTRVAALSADRVLRDDVGATVGLALATESDPTACGAASGSAVPDHDVVYRVARDDQHAVRWRTSGTGRAHGLRTTVDDLADVRRIDVLLGEVVGQPRGMVRLTHHVDDVESWSGVAEIRPSAGSAWRGLELSGLELTWTRTPSGATEQATLAQFLLGRDKAAGAPRDDVFVGLGCAGDDFALDDLRISRTEQVDLRWDLEAPKPTGRFVRRFTSPFVGGPRGCGISFGDYPHVAERQIHLEQPSGYQVIWSSTARHPVVEDDFDGVPTRRAPAGTSKITFPVKRTGFVVLRLRGTASRRSHSTQSYPVRAVPDINLHGITKRVPVGRSMIVTGQVLPKRRHRIQLYRTPGSGRGYLTGVGPVVRTDAQGRFELRTRAAAVGRFAYAVRTAPSTGLDGAMSGTVLRTSVYRPTPAPVPPPQPAPVVVPAPSQPPVVIPPIVYPRLVTGAGRVAAACRFRVG